MHDKRLPQMLTLRSAKNSRWAFSNYEQFKVP